MRNCKPVDDFSSYSLNIYFNPKFERMLYTMKMPFLFDKYKDIILTQTETEMISYKKE